METSDTKETRMGKDNSGAWAGADNSNQDEGSCAVAGQEDTGVGVGAVTKVLYMNMS